MRGHRGLVRTGEALCGRCLSAPPPWRNFFLHGVYRDELRDALLRLKNGRELALAHCLGQLMAAHPGLARDYDALVPCPIHPARLRERGFNQALELARPVAAALKVPLRPQLLRRTKKALPQTGLSLEARRNNLEGVFSAGGAQGLTLLLLDDVSTTGTTLEKATAALLAAGAENVDVLVAARTPLHG
jgi:predicted amidophosphoribosyltransferase